MIGSHIVTIEAGRSAALDRFDPQKSQGIIYVDNKPFYTPLKAGPVIITAIEGTRAILTPEDPQAPRIQFVFDLARRVWLSPDTAPDAPLAAEWVECPNSMTDPRRYYFSCWEGTIGQDTVNLAAGRETGIRGIDGKGVPYTYDTECCQGVLRISSYNAKGELYRTELYPTPYKVGYVRVVSVKGPLVTLAAYGDTSLKYTLVFDVASRTWIQPKSSATNTMKLGSQACLGDYNFGWRYMLNYCWTGKVEGRIFSLASGIEGNPDNRDQGLLIVMDGADIDPISDRKEVYLTPLKVGDVSLILVDKTYAYLQTADKAHTFVFDLNSRQWLKSFVPPTPSITSTPRPQPTYPAAGSTEQIERERKLWQTAVASIPTFTPVPTILQTPDALWKFERVDCGPDASTLNPLSCWGGVGDGALLSVWSYAAYDDTRQGMVGLCPGLFFCSGGSSYKSPLKLGALHIVSINGKLARLTPDDGQSTQIFDLQAKQWVPPSTTTTRPLSTGHVPCPDYSMQHIDSFGCWQGLVGNETIQLRTGREAGAKYTSAGNPEANCCKGVLEVGQYGRNTKGDYGYYTTIYTTTQQSSALYLVSVKGQRVTLGSYDPALKGKTWVFDLDKREWLNP